LMFLQNFDEAENWPCLSQPKNSSATAKTLMTGQSSSTRGGTGMKNHYTINTTTPLPFTISLVSLLLQHSLLFLTTSVLASL